MSAQCYNLKKKEVWSLFYLLEEEFCCLNLHVRAEIDQMVLHTFPCSWNQFFVNCPHLASWSPTQTGWCLSGVITRNYCGKIDWSCLNLNEVATCGQMWELHWISCRHMFGLKTKVVKCNDQTAAEEANSLLHSKACENWNEGFSPKENLGEKHVFVCNLSPSHVNFLKQ